MGKVILQWISCTAAGEDQGRGKDGKRSGVKCTGISEHCRREKRDICAQPVLGRRNPAVAVGSATDIPDSLVHLLLHFLCRWSLWLVPVYHWSSPCILAEVV